MQRINGSVFLAAIVLLAVVSVGWAGEKAEEPAKADIHHLASIDDLNKSITEHDYLFVVLPGVEKGNGSIQKVALAAAKMAEADDIVVCVAELNRDCEGFKKHTKKAGVKKFPAILMVRKDGTKAIVQGDITEKHLAKAFAELAGAESNTCPFASKHSNCDPTACGFKK